MSTLILHGVRCRKWKWKRRQNRSYSLIRIKTSSTTHTRQQHGYELVSMAKFIWNLCRGCGRNFQSRKGTVLHLSASRRSRVAGPFNIESSDKGKITPLINAFQAYCEGKADITVTHYQFNSYNQTTECMDVYIRELQYRITFCEFGARVDSLLCDCLVCGIKDKALWNMLLQTPNLELAHYMEMCRLSEHQSALLSDNATEWEN